VRPALAPDRPNQSDPPNLPDLPNQNNQPNQTNSPAINPEPPAGNSAATIDPTSSNATSSATAPFYVERPTTPALLERFWAERAIPKSLAELTPEKYYPEYENDPHYGAKIDPARIKQFVGEDPQTLPPLKLLCPTHTPLALTGELLPFELLVQSTPHKWTTFYAPDDGTFEENGKHGLTVKADAQGYARARFRLGPREGQRHARNHVALFV
jgi:hypothetical protein